MGNDTALETQILGGVESEILGCVLESKILGFVLESEIPGCVFKSEILGCVLERDPWLRVGE